MPKLGLSSPKRYSEVRSKMKYTRDSDGIKITVEEFDFHHIRVTGYNGACVNIQEIIPGARIKIQDNSWIISFDPWLIDSKTACKTFYERYVCR